MVDRHDCGADADHKLNFNGIVGRAGRRAIEIFFDTMALTIGALLPIINPFSTAPLFVSLTAGFDEARRKQQALLG